MLTSAYALNGGLPRFLCSCRVPFPTRHFSQTPNLVGLKAVRPWPERCPTVTDSRASGRNHYCQHLPTAEIRLPFERLATTFALGSRKGEQRC